MDEAEIRQAVLETLKSIAPELDIRELRSDQPLRRQADLDSMDWLNILTALHERFQVEIAESDYGTIGTVDGLVACIGSRRPESVHPPMHQGPGYPSELVREHFLFDGRRVCIRPIRPEDEKIEADFVRHLSSDSRYERFMVAMNELSPAKLKYLTNVDYEHHMALVATQLGEGPEVEVGVARYVIAPGTLSCEFAIAVDDAWQGSGLAGALMATLIDVARSKGLSEMEGFVLAANHKMLKFARQMGFKARLDPEDRQTVHVLLKL